MRLWLWAFALSLNRGSLRSSAFCPRPPPITRTTKRGIWNCRQALLPHAPLSRPLDTTLIPGSSFRMTKDASSLKNNEDDKKSPTSNKSKSSSSPRNKKNKKKPPYSKKQQTKQQKKELLAKTAAELRQQRQKQQQKSSQQQPMSSRDQESDSTLDKKSKLLNMLDPFQAGQKLRRTLDSALTTLGATAGLSSDRRSVYYVDDRFSEPLFSERNPVLDRMEADGYVPEVLVVGATGEVGRLVTRRLLLDGRFRVRVLVRDLYSKTLNLLGTGVTYCQGDLGNVESLEYAVTDVDKIIFCAASPRPDEVGFQEKFKDFCNENLESMQEQPMAEKEKTQTDLEWEQLESVLELRARLAEQVDCIGMQNLVRAYQNVRHADYGTSQAAKRSLFKFQDRPEDFRLFAIDDEEGDDFVGVMGGSGEVSMSSGDAVSSDASYPSTLSGSGDYQDYDYDDTYDEYDDDLYAKMDEEYANSNDPYVEYDCDEELQAEEAYTATATRKGAAVKMQVQWTKNKFDHGVFVGKVPKEVAGIGGEAAVVSSRLRSRDDPENGIDLSNGFAGFVCRVCSDGGTYEAFVRTGSYDTDGIEYVCEFNTSFKPQMKGNKSRNKFTTIRLPFENFKPVQRGKGAHESSMVPPFKGSDVRQLGFRYLSERNKLKAKFEAGKLTSFYLALSYIKVYRYQPEPEFVYLSDSRIPPVVTSGMVRHAARQLVPSTGSGDADSAVSLLDEASLKSVVTGDRMGRSSEETYFKYRGEEILKSSGLSYAIVRVLGYNESPTGEASTIDLCSSNEDVMAVSRDEVAQVCASALLDPNALNKSFYVSKSKRKSKNLSLEEDMSSKFSSLPVDVR